LRAMVYNGVVLVLLDLVEYAVKLAGELGASYSEARYHGINGFLTLALSFMGARSLLPVFKEDTEYKACINVGV